MYNNSALCLVHWVGQTSFCFSIRFYGKPKWHFWPTQYVHSEVTQSCSTLWNPMDCSLPGSSIHGIHQARILEWTAISFSMGSSRSRDRTQVSCIVGRRFNLWATREAHMYIGCIYIYIHTHTHIYIYMNYK